MSDPKSKLSASSEDQLAGDVVARWSVLRPIARQIGKLRAWAAVHWLRSTTVAGVILLLIASTMAGWAYLASMALRGRTVSVDVALDALDDRQYDEARAAVTRMLKSGRLPRNEYGGALFVLGAVKSHEAERQATVEERQIDYLVASRYLKEARPYGFPPGRHAVALYLLGNSLVESGQFEEGIETLNELLDSELPADSPLVWNAHRVLANTCLFMPRPTPEISLRHNDALLSRPDVSPAVRAGVLLQRAECLTRLERFPEAQAAAADVPPEENRRGEVQLMQGKIVLDEINAVLQRIATQDRPKTISDSASQVKSAMQLLEQANSLDSETTHVKRQASYHFGRGLELQGDLAAAVEQFTHTRQLYNDTFEGMAAALAEADLRRQQGDIEGSLQGYRRVLEAFTSPARYQSVVLSLPRMRERIMAAWKFYVDEKHFDEALNLLEEFPPMFSRTEQLELRGNTLEQWGNLLVNQATDADEQSAADRSAGLYHLRAAGVAFEQLAGLRFATRSYTEDVWRSAENYFRGHSFSRTVQLINTYLEYEPVLRNAEAQLRLGQAYLALGRIPESISAFEECIEFHALDSSTHQARIDCAKAYWYQGNMSRAEQLLRENIAGSALKPISREWKDSLFELGMLLHEMGRHEEAIGTLEEAIERYPQDPQRLDAQYLIGESYRRWGQDFMERLTQARTTGERQKNRDAATERLATALRHFDEVQRTITLKTHDINRNPLMGTMLRNCYMLEGSVFFQLGRYKEAIESYSNVASLYPDEPFVLETFVQIANCWWRLERSDKARGSIEQAQMALERLPPDANFVSATALKRDDWRMLLAEMMSW